MVRALLFDLDGVLVDSSESIACHWRQWAAARGLDGDAVVAFAHGRPTADTIGEIDPHADFAAEAQALERRQALDTSGVVAMPGALELLTCLPADRVAVVTSGGRQLARARLAAAGLPQPRPLITADDVEHGKPSGDGYLLAARYLGVSSDDCVVIEDAPTGVAAGKAAGMHVIAMTTTFPRAALEEADLLVNDLATARSELGLRWPVDSKLRPVVQKPACVPDGSSS